MTTPAEKERFRPRSQAWVNAGLLAFAAGVFLLAAGALQRWDGRLSRGGRSGPMKTMAREEDPAFFDRVTWAPVAGGVLLTVGGLAVASRAARPRPPSGEPAR